MLELLMRRGYGRLRSESSFGVLGSVAGVAPAGAVLVAAGAQTGTAAVAPGVAWWTAAGARELDGQA